MSRTIFITGGARSGKSRFAEQMASGYGAPLCYLATAQPLDAEMGLRLVREGWRSVYIRASQGREAARKN